MADAALQDGAAWIDGRIVRVAEAKNLRDRLGADPALMSLMMWCMFGKGHSFRLDDYLGRFFNSIQALRLDVPHSKDGNQGLSCMTWLLRPAFRVILRFNGRQPGQAFDPGHSRSQVV